MPIDDTRPMAPSYFLCILQKFWILHNVDAHNKRKWLTGISIRLLEKNQLVFERSTDRKQTLEMVVSIIISIKIHSPLEITD